MQTIQVKPKQTVQVKVKPCVKLASLALFDTALLTIYNQAKETIKRTTNGKLEINQQDQGFAYQVGKDIAQLQETVAALQTAATTQQGTKTQWVQKVTLKPGSTESWINVKVNPELVGKVGVALYGKDSVDKTHFKEIYEMPADASYFPLYLIAFADPEQVDFVSEVG